jgi:hypothetical protein
LSRRKLRGSADERVPPSSADRLLQCIANNQSNSSITVLDYLFDAHFDSRATMLADNPKVENLTTSDGFLIAD